MKAFHVTLGVGLLSFVAASAQESQTVTLETEDGVEIVGDYYAPKGRGSPVVILLHMYRSERATWRPLTPALHEAGFAVLAIDMRGHGQSVYPASKRMVSRAAQRDATLFNEMDRDVAAAHSFIARQRDVDPSRVAIVGASVGCSVAIGYAAGDRSVDVVVCMTPGENYLGVDSVKDIKKYGDRPILLLATEDERKASDTLGKVNAAATVQIVGEGRVHGTRMFGKIDGIEERIVSFLSEHVGQYTEHPVVAALNGDVYFAYGSQEHMNVPHQMVRWFSSVEEARARGLKGPDSPYEGRIGDFGIGRRGIQIPPPPPPRVWIERMDPPQQEEGQDP